MITKDTLIGDLARDHPESLVVLIGKGLHCIGCSLSPFETIEQGAKGHGFNDEEVDGIVKEINASIAEMKKRAAGAKSQGAEKEGKATEAEANTAKPGLKKGKRTPDKTEKESLTPEKANAAAIMHEQPPIRLTREAAEKVMQLIKSEKKEGKGLRVYIVNEGKSEGGTKGKNEKGSQGNRGGAEGKRTGGEQFEMDFDEPKEGDEVYESFGLKVFFEKKLKEKIGGMEIGYRPETNAFVVRRRTMQQAAIQDLETMASEGKKRLKEKGIRESDIPGIVERSRQTQASD